jgi:hypothetical protein
MEQGAELITTDEHFEKISGLVYSKLWSVWIWRIIAGHFENIGSKGNKEQVTRDLVGRNQFHIVDVKPIAWGGIVGKPETQAGVVHKAVEVFSGEVERVGLPIGSEVGDC